MNLIIFVLIGIGLVYLASEIGKTRKLVDSGKIGSVKVDVSSVNELLQKLRKLDIDKIRSVIAKIDSIEVSEIKNMLVLAQKFDDQVCAANDGYLFKPGRAAKLAGLPEVKIC